jgi:hypothetical protein
MIVYMDRITSSEFRKRYASITGPTVVTVYGHAIGTWTPSSAWLAQPIAPAERILATGSREYRERFVEHLGPDGVRELRLDPTFNSRPFTPVPKKR